MEQLIEELTRGNVTEVKVVLATVVLALAVYQLVLGGGGLRLAAAAFLEAAHRLLDPPGQRRRDRRPDDPVATACLASTASRRAAPTPSSARPARRAGAEGPRGPRRRPALPPSAPARHLRPRPLRPHLADLRRRLPRGRLMRRPRQSHPAARLAPGGAGDRRDRDRRRHRPLRPHQHRQAGGAEDVVKERLEPREERAEAAHEAREERLRKEGPRPAAELRGPPGGGPGLVHGTNAGTAAGWDNARSPFARRCPGWIPPGAQTSAAPSGPAPPESLQACDSKLGPPPFSGLRIEANRAVALDSAYRASPLAALSPDRRPQWT